MNSSLVNPAARSSGSRAVVVALAVVCVFTSNGVAAQETPVRWLTPAETEDMVRTFHYEGMPEDEAKRIGPDACERLVGLLGRASEREHHGRILVALGTCGAPGAYEAIEAWMAVPRAGEIDRATFRAWQALPFALGRLAEHDSRALDLLGRELEAGEAPTWTFRHHRGARLVRNARRAAASALAESGLDEAGTLLERAGQRSSDPELRAHVREARERHRERRARRLERQARRLEGRR